MNNDPVEVVREPQTEEASILVHSSSVFLVPLDPGEDRRAYNKRVRQIEDAVRATVALLEKREECG